MNDIKIGPPTIAGLNYSKLQQSNAKKTEDTTAIRFEQADCGYKMASTLEDKVFYGQKLEKLSAAFNQENYEINLDQLVDNLIAEDLNLSETLV